MRKSVYFTLMLLSLLAFASPALATKITNLTTDTVLFEDDFEGVGACTGSYSTSSTDDCDPTADIGSYTIEEQYPYGLQVCTGSDGVISSAAEGDNYLRMVRTGDSAKITYANFTSTQSTASDVLRLESMIAITNMKGYTTKDTKAGFFAFITPGVSMPGLFASVNEGIFNTLVPNGSGYTFLSIYYDSNNEFTSNSAATPLTFSSDTWHTLAVDYAMGASTYSVTLDDVTVSGVPVYSALNSVSCVRIMAGETNEEAIYLDHVAEVPEPSTIAMLIAGALAGTCCLRRRA